MHSNSGQWSDLPIELLATIGELLDTCIDVLRFRAVCSSWRSSLTPIPTFCPLSTIKIPFPISPDPSIDPHNHAYFSLIESTVYSLQPLHNKTSTSSSSSKGWLVKLREEKPGQMLLLKPLSNDLVDPPPDSLPKVMNLLDFRVSEVKKVYNLEFVDLNEHALLKAVVSSSSPTGSGAVDDCAIMAIYSEGELGYFKFGDKKWTTIDDGREISYFVDIAYHRGKFYALDHECKVLVINSSLKFREIAPPARYMGVQYGNRYNYFVESFGDLFLIDRPDEGELDYTFRFKVYKLNDEEKLWVPVKSLGDRAFFVGDDCCYSVSARDFPGCKQNCIYIDVSFNEENDDNSGFPFGIIGMIDLEDGTVGPLSYFPGYSQIFWPPPTWLNPKPSSSPC